MDKRSRRDLWEIECKKKSCPKKIIPLGKYIEEKYGYLLCTIVENCRPIKYAIVYTDINTSIGYIELLTNESNKLLAMVQLWNKDTLATINQDQTFFVNEKHLLPINNYKEIKKRDEDKSKHRDDSTTAMRSSSCSSESSSSSAASSSCLSLTASCTSNLSSKAESMVVEKEPEAEPAKQDEAGSSKTVASEPVAHDQNKAGRSALVDFHALNVPVMPPRQPYNQWRQRGRGYGPDNGWYRYDAQGNYYELSRPFYRNAGYGDNYYRTSVVRTRGRGYDRVRGRGRGHVRGRYPRLFF